MNSGCSGALNERWRDRLTDMAGGVLGGVKQEAEHRGRQAGAAHFPVVEERCRRRVPELLECLVDVTTDVGDEGGYRNRRISGLALGPERRTLRIGQRLAAGVGEEPIEGAAGMAHVKTDGRGTAGTVPHMFSGNARGQTVEILTRLNERVHDGHQQRLEPGYRPALPGFGLNSGHATTVLPMRAA